MAKNILKFAPGADPKFEKSLLNYMANQFQQKVNHLKDPATGQPPKIELVEDASLNNLQFRIIGSDELVAEARKVIGG